MHKAARGTRLKQVISMGAMRGELGGRAFAPCAPTYMYVCRSCVITAQVDTLQCWQDSHIEADQVVGVKHAVAKLRASGHPEAKVLCAKELKTDAGMVG